MPSSSPDCPASLSASGYEDGLGRRSLVFDREAGDTVERLALRPELAAFERVLAERAARLADFDDARIARPRSVRRDSDTTLVVVDSAFVPGTRLADAIDLAADGTDDGAAGGIDVAVGLLLEMLPALGALHTAAGMRHGVVGPGRTVLTADGRVVLLDVIFADAVQRLQCAAPRLWSAFGLAVTPGPGPARLDAAMDLSQAGLSALMLVLGRPLGPQPFPSQFPAAFAEAMEIAHIRGSAAFAAHFERFMRRLLPFPDRRTFSSAKDAFDELRDIAGAEIGIATCRAALAALAQAAVIGPATGPVFSEAAEPPAAAPPPAAPAGVAAPALEVRPPAPAAPVLSFSHFVTPPAAAAVPTPHVRPVVPAAVVTPASVTPPPVANSAEQLAAEVVPQPIATPPPMAVGPIAAFTQPPVAAESNQEPAASMPPAREAAAPAEPVAAARAEPAPVAPAPAAASARRKRNRGGPRAKRDKLRSHAAPPAPLLAPVKPPVPEPAPAPAPVAPLIPAPAPALVAPLTPAPSLIPAALIPVDPAPRPAVAPIRMPFAASVEPRPETSGYASDRLWEAPAPAPKHGPGPIPLADAGPRSTPPAVAAAPAAPHAPLRIKADPPVKQGGARPRPARAVEANGPALLVNHPQPAPRGGFSWKAAAAAVVLIGAALAGGWGYLSGRDPSTVTAAPKPTPAAVVDPPPAAPASPKAGGTIEVTSTPSGAKVLLDGAAVGVTPVTLTDVPPGRRVVTLVSSAGTVRRTVRVQPGQSVPLDVPVYSGFVTISAPVILEVAVGGRSIGTTEQGRLLLPPGRHELTLSNRDLDYLATHMVEIESGEEFRTRVDPRGKVNINAVPWAEVWIDGQRAGETPLANLSLPLGTHEVVFKHPQFGERRLTTTLKASASATVSVDFTRPDGGGD